MCSAKFSPSRGLAPRAEAKPNMEENIITCPRAYVSNILFEQIVSVVLYLNRNINFTSYVAYSSGSQPLFIEAGETAYSSPTVRV